MERHTYYNKWPTFWWNSIFTENVLESWNPGHHGHSIIKMWTPKFFWSWPYSGQAKNAVFRLFQDFAWPLRPQNLITPKFYGMSVMPQLSQFWNSFWKCRIPPESLFIYCNMCVHKPSCILDGMCTLYLYLLSKLCWTFMYLGWNVLHIK